MSRPLANRLWYNGLQWLLRVLFAPLVRFRSHGHEQVPMEGPVLILSNHQSNFDPVLVGMACRRRLNYLARQTLFKNKFFGWLLHSLDTIPLDRDGLGVGGLKETLKRLKRNEMVLIFPEGTRTRDGQIAPLKPGFCALARRSNVTLVPVALDGAYQAWPRNLPLPRWGTFAVQFGKPISQEEIAPLDDGALVRLVEQRMRECHAAAQSKREQGAK